MNLVERDRVYAEMLGYCREKGWKPGWAWFMCREMFGNAPRTKPAPIVPSQATRNLIRSQMIRYAKQKRKEETAWKSKTA